MTKIFVTICLFLPLLAFSSTDVSSPFFTKAEIESGEFVNIKHEYRKSMFLNTNQSDGMKSGRGYEDMIGKFFDETNPAVRNIHELDKLNIKDVRLSQDIWSSSYWPLYRGGIAYRYAGGGARKTNFRWNQYKSNWPPAARSSRSINRLSPAEKYDLLIGDKSYGLSGHMWSKGKAYVKAHGRVHNWAGYCHGWAVASVYEKRPLNSVTVKSADGREITFRPADIKALASVLWANGEFKMMYTGSRCYDKKPRLRGRLKRIEKQRCFDINPGLWHTILLNMVGKRGESFVFDASYDAEVWNHPIVGYKYEYVNRKTRKIVPTLADAMVAVGSFGDAYAGYRSKSAKHIVGVRLTLEYKHVHAPSRDATNNASKDRHKKRTYRYDLEIDEKGLIIGGEWHQLSHPDMVWKAEPGSMAASAADKTLNQSIDLTAGEYPEGWLGDAAKSARGGTPSATIIRQLIELSRQ